MTVEVNLEELVAEDFDVATWIEKFISSSDDINLSTSIHTFLIALSAERERVSKELDDTIQKVILMIPKFKLDMQIVKENVKKVSTQVETAKKEMNRIQSESYEIFDNLMNLDYGRGKLLELKKIFEEKLEWDNISKDIEKSFANKELDKVAELLSRLQENTHLNEVLEDFHERKQYTKGLIERYLKEMDPLIGIAIKQRDSDACKNYYQMTSQVQEREHFVKLYNQIRYEDINALWQDLVVKLPSNDSIKGFQNFYSTFNAFIVTELHWISKLFPDFLKILILNIQFSFASLEPSVESFILDKKFSWENYNEIFKHTVDFVAAVDYILLDYTLDDKFNLEWSNSILSSFDFLFKSFFSKEEEYLTSRILSIIPNFNSSTIKDTLKAYLSTINLKYSSEFELSIGRTFCISKTFGLIDYLKMSNNVFKKVSMKSSEMIQEIKEYFQSVHHDLSPGSTSITYLKDWTAFDIGLLILNSCLSLTNFLTATFPEKVLMTYNQAEHAKCINAIENSSFIYFLNQSHFNSPQLTELLSNFNLEKLTTCMVEASQSLKTMTRISQIYLFDLLFHPIENLFYLLSKSPVWSLEEESSNISPSTQIATIGEELLGLPQHLEQRAIEHEKALLFSIESLPYLDSVDVADSDAAMIWIQSIIYGTLHRYSELLFDMPFISKRGCKQALADMNYLKNICETLEIDCPSDFVHLAGCISLPISELATTDNSDYLPFKDRLLRIRRKSKTIKITL